MAEFFEFPEDDLSRFGAAVCSNGQNYGWWGESKQSGFKLTVHKG